MACGGRLLVPDASWRELHEYTYESRDHQSCQGGETGWLLGQSAVDKRVVEVKSGRIARLQVTTSGFDPFASGPRTIERSSFVVDFTRQRTDGFAGVRVESLDGKEAKSLVREAYQVDRVVPDVDWPASGLAPAVERTFGLGIDGDDHLHVRAVGLVDRTFGRVRAFAVSGKRTEKTAGLGHAWTIEFDVQGATYLAADEDIPVEASLDVRIWGRDHGRTCARGVAHVRFRVACEASITAP